MLDRQRREMELRVKKTQDSVDDHVKQLCKQVENLFWLFFFVLAAANHAGSTGKRGI